jgi:uncharacterized protein GlcG (DUF336 family)
LSFPAQPYNSNQIAWTLFPGSVEAKPQERRQPRSTPGASENCGIASLDSANKGGRVKHKSLIAMVCWIALVPARAAEGVVTYKSLAPDTALDLARSALQQCREDGYQVAVVVSDRFGAPLVELRDRYTPVGALDIAKGKAWTSVTFTRNTSDFVKAIKDGTIGVGLGGLPGVTPLAGGVVIEAGGSLLGAVGVAGAPGGDKDEACAKAGVAAVQDKLEF